MAFAITNPVPFDVGESGLWGYILNTALDLIEGEQNTKTTNLNFADYELQSALLVDTAEKISTASSSGGVLTLDYSAANHYYVTLTENITSVVITNPPATAKLAYLTVEVTQGAVPYTITWGSAFKFPFGAVPVISTGSGDVDILTYRARNAGTTWYNIGLAQDLS